MIEIVTVEALLEFSASESGGSYEMKVADLGVNLWLRCLKSAEWSVSLLRVCGQAEYGATNSSFSQRDHACQPEE